MCGYPTPMVVIAMLPRCVSGRRVQSVQGFALAAPGTHVTQIPTSLYLILLRLALLGSLCYIRPRDERRGCPFLFWPSEAR